MKPRSQLPLLLAGAALAISQAHLIYLLGALRPNLFVLQLCFDSRHYWEILEQWGADGLQRYLTHFAYDYVHLPIYASFGYLLATRGGALFVSGRGQEQLAIWLLPLAALFDLGENLAQAWLLAQEPGTLTPVVALSALCSAAKWGLIVLFVLIMALRILRRIR